MYPCFQNDISTKLSLHPACFHQHPESYAAPPCNSGPLRRGLFSKLDKNISIIR